MHWRNWTVIRSLFALILFAGLAPASIHAGSSFPEVINLPTGWLAEGIVTGRGPVIYAGSRAQGAIYQADLRTGEGSVLVPPQPGRVTVGLDFDRRTNYIYAAGGGNGNAFVFDADTGALVQTYQFATAPTFVNDVIVTRDAAYFTDSNKPVLYRVPLGPGGEPASSFDVVPLGGEYQHGAGFNANGIEATSNGKWLIIVQSSAGRLYRVDAATGAASVIDLGGEAMTNGDGLLLLGKTLYVVRNRNNEIVEIDLSGDLSEGEVADRITNPNFDVPTTVAAFGNRLYAVNGRFTTPNPATAEFQIVQVRR